MKRGRARPTAPAEGADEYEDSYYAPMADLLSGILFVILVLLMSFAIIHYPDAESIPISTLHPANVQTQPAEPEVDARARRLLALERVRSRLIEGVVADLRAEGMAVSADFAGSRIVIDEAGLFKAGGTRLTFTGERNAKAIGMILSRRLRCFAESCPESEGGRLDAVFLDITATSQDLANAGLTVRDPRAFAAARAISLMGGLVEGDMSLLQLRNAAGGQILHSSGNAGEGKDRIVLGFAFSEKVGGGEVIPQQPR